LFEPKKGNEMGFELTPSNFAVTSVDQLSRPIPPDTGIAAGSPGKPDPTPTVSPGQPVSSPKAIAKVGGGIDPKSVSANDLKGTTSAGLALEVRVTTTTVRPGSGGASNTSAIRTQVKFPVGDNLGKNKTFVLLQATQSETERVSPKGVRSSSTSTGIRGAVQGKVPIDKKTMLTLEAGASYQNTIAGSAPSSERFGVDASAEIKHSVNKKLYFLVKGEGFLNTTSSAGKPDIISAQLAMNAEVGVKVTHAVLLKGGPKVVIPCTDGGTQQQSNLTVALGAEFQINTNLTAEIGVEHNFTNGDDTAFVRAKFTL
jgi:hypothetical protein